MKLRTFFSRKSLLFSFEVLPVLLVCCFPLFAGIMVVNEIDVLPIAKQFVNHTWISGDWYLNQDAGYRAFFQFLFGHLINQLGFLSGSIIGRFLCWGLTAIGLVLIGKKLRLNIFLLLLAVFLYLYPESIRSLITKIISRLYLPNLHLFSLIMIILLALIILCINVFGHYKHHRSKIIYCLILIGWGFFLLGNNSSHGMIARETIIADLQAKTPAYSFVILALAALLWRYYKLMAFSLGLATSFHVLVGGYAFLTSLGSVLLLPKSHRLNKFNLGVILLIYLISSCFAIRPVLQQILTAAPSGSISYSYIYVFLRLPHHLNPATWPSDWWWTLVGYLLMLIISFLVIKIKLKTTDLSQDLFLSASTLVKFALIAMIPFLMGLVIAPFDSKGSFLQYYPFRFGDVILPLNACFIFTLALQEIFTNRFTKLFLLTISSIIVIYVTNLNIPHLQKDLAKVRQFPIADLPLKNMYEWIKVNTSKEDIFITSPSKLENFTWITERPTIAKLKFLPQQKVAILEWNNRLQDLNGGSVIWPETVDREYNVWRNVGIPLAKNYNQLTSEQVIALMKKYKSNYFVTENRDYPELNLVYHNQKYFIYTNLD